VNKLSFLMIKEPGSIATKKGKFLAFIVIFLWYGLIDLDQERFRHMFQFF
jgi:hypothetical protein